jgi:hypothetical protein
MMLQFHPEDDAAKSSETLVPYGNNTNRIPRHELGNFVHWPFLIKLNFFPFDHERRV